MAEGSAQTGPDLSQGVPLDTIDDGGMVAGHVGDEALLLVRRGGELFAVGATCTHYSGPLGEGLVVDDTVRCPWHHACFDLRTGRALRAPALNDLTCWRVEQRDGMALVREALPAAASPKLPETGLPASVVIVGGGAAGHDLALVDPALHADPAKRGGGLVEAVVDIGAQRVQRDPTVGVALGARHLGAAQAP
jgi:nitrite reductase/ring-hydroxylating ferredoxin subunit